MQTQSELIERTDPTDPTDRHGIDRVRDHTSPRVNERLDRLTRATIEDYRNAPPEQVGRRLAELDREWDADRAMMINFSLAGGVTLALALRQIHQTRGRLSRSPFLFLFGAQMSFLALHAIVGWCPPVALFRRLGFRTSKEIQRERSALESELASRSTSESD